MANLYQIDEKLECLIEGGFDISTGEILDEAELFKAIDEISMELNKKIENIGAYYKNLLSDVEAIKAEEDNLKKRRQTINNKAEGLKKYLDMYFRNQQSEYFEEKDAKFKKFESPKCVISYRKSNSVKLKDLNKIPKEYIKEHQLEEKDVKKAEIKKYLNNHPEENDFAELVTNKSITIK